MRCSLCTAELPGTVDAFTAGWRRWRLVTLEKPYFIDRDYCTEHGVDEVRRDVNLTRAAVAGKSTL